MDLEIIVNTERKGSNPGGKGIVRFSEYDMPMYLKYCPGSRIPPKWGFNPQNQPVYESITAKMARELGLHIPNFWVLINRNHDLKFDLRDGADIDTNRKYYFVSEL